MLFLLLFAAVKNQATGNIFLNDEDDFPETRSIIEKGVEWEYQNNDDMEVVQTSGPLKYSVLIMVSTHGYSWSGRKDLILYVNLIILCRSQL